MKPVALARPRPPHQRRGGEPVEHNTMFATLISLAALGVAGSLVIRYLHSRVVFWDKGSAAQTAATE